MAMAMAIPAMVSVVGGLMAGKKGKKNPGPSIPPQLLPFFNSALGMANMGQSGFQMPTAPSSLTAGMPDITQQLTNLLQPGVDRQFASGAADLREQSALTGNLSGSGIMNQLGDYRAQLGNGLQGQIANSYNAILPGLIAANAGLTSEANRMPLEMWQGGINAGLGIPMAQPTYRQGPIQTIGQGLMGASSAMGGGKSGGAGKGGGGKGK